MSKPSLLSYVQNLVIISQAVTKEFVYNEVAIPGIRLTDYNNSNFTIHINGYFDIRS